jgi:ATP-binding cassette, subfamily F, member 3
MRMLANAEPPDAGTRREGHQVVMQYFAQDEAARLDPAKTVYETLEAESPIGMVPMIRNILGGFLFSGDDIQKKAAVLSGGERTRLAVARMLLTPANTLLLDEPTNHLDLDSKDVLLDALEDFGGTLIFVSHDRYFVDKLATKIIEVGHGGIEVYPGTYEQFLWSKAHRSQPVTPVDVPAATAPATAAAPRPRPAPERPADTPVEKPAVSYEQKKSADAAARKRKRALDERSRRIAELESRIAEREQAIKDLEAQMAAAGFYDERDKAQEIVHHHQKLMWEVGDLMNQWEALQADAGEPSTVDN